MELNEKFSHAEIVHYAKLLLKDAVLDCINDTEDSANTTMDRLEYVQSMMYWIPPISAVEIEMYYNKAKEEITKTPTGEMFQRVKRLF